LATLRLKIHPIKSQLTQTNYGAIFVGFRVLPDRIRVRNHNLQKGRTRLKQLQIDYAQGKLSSHEVAQSLQSWSAHLAHGDTWRLRQKIFTDLDLPYPLK
jgi:retron-type reverse transcriptase